MATVDAGGEVAASPVAPVVLAVRTLTAARGGIEARLLEAAKVAVAAAADELLALKGYVSVEELTRGQRTKLRTEAKATAVAELMVGGRYSRDEARHLVGVACAPGRIPGLVINALDRAWVTWWQVRLFWMRCAKLEPEAAQQVAQRLFGSDPQEAAEERLDPDGDLGDDGWDHTRYRAALEREATRAEGQDVEAERARRREAYRARTVSITAHDNGTGTLALTTDLVALCGVHARVERIARLLRAGGDERNLDQLRADVCAALLVHGTIPTLDKDEDDLTPGDLEELSRILSGQPKVQIQVVVGWDSLTCTPTCPHCGHGYAVRAGTEEAETPGRGAGVDPPDRRAGVDPPDRRGGVDPPGRGAGTGPPGRDAGAAPPGRGETSPPPLALRPTTTGGVAEILGRLGTFITPGHARELFLRSGTTLARLLMDPADGRLRERTIATYRPDADMRRQVIAADLYSRTPTGRQPASSCELDHVIPWSGEPGGGSTCELNLAAAMKEWHQRKTQRRCRVVINERRDLTWTTLLATTVTTREHDFRQYLDRIRSVLAGRDTSDASDASDIAAAQSRGVEDPRPRQTLPPPQGGAHDEVERMGREEFLAAARSIYRQAATDSAPLTAALPGHEEELKDAVRLRAAQALYAAIVHRGPDSFLEDVDDLPEAPTEARPAAGSTSLTHSRVAHSSGPALPRTTPRPRRSSTWPRSTRATRPTRRTRPARPT